MLDSKMILDITTFAIGPQMKSIVSHSSAKPPENLPPFHRVLVNLGLTRSGQGISLARSGRGCLVSRVMLFLKNITSHSSLHAISNMLFSFNRLRRVYYASLAVCSGRGIL
jgi:hypothetical protein